VRPTISDEYGAEKKPLTILDVRHSRLTTFLEFINQNNTLLCRRQTKRWTDGTKKDFSNMDIMNMHEAMIT